MAMPDNGPCNALSQGEKNKQMATLKNLFHHNEVQTAKIFKIQKAITALLFCISENLIKVIFNFTLVAVIQHFASTE